MPVSLQGGLFVRNIVQSHERNKGPDTAYDECNREHMSVSTFTYLRTFHESFFFFFWEGNYVVLDVFIKMYCRLPSAGQAGPRLLQHES